MLTSAAMLPRRAASLPEPDRNTILLFVSSVLMKGRTCRDNPAVLSYCSAHLYSQVCNRRHGGCSQGGSHSMEMLVRTCGMQISALEAHHAPDTPEYEWGIQEPQGMQALWIVRLQKLKYCLQGLHIQVPGTQACMTTCSLRDYWSHNRDADRAQSRTSSLHSAGGAILLVQASS